MAKPGFPFVSLLHFYNDLTETDKHEFWKV